MVAQAISRSAGLALDWTSFARDGHETIVLSMLTGHGRATPLMWRTVQASTLKGNQRGYEDELLRALRNAMPSGVKVTVVADRGFGNGLVIQCLSEELGFEYVLRVRGDIYVTSANGERRRASDWVGRNLSTTLRHRRLRFTEQSLLLWMWMWQVG